MLLAHGVVGHVPLELVALAVLVPGAITILVRDRRRRRDAQRIDD